MTRDANLTGKRSRSEVGKLGAAARHAKLSPERRSEIATKAGKANARRVAHLKALEAALLANPPETPEAP